MNFFAVLLALLVEQARPLPAGNRVHQALLAWTRWTSRNFDAGRGHHAWIVWTISVIVPALVTGGVFVVLGEWNLVFAFGWNVLVLYLTLGFRQFSHTFTDLRDALAHGDEARARRLLAAWRHLDTIELPRDELLRHVIEQALLAAHRHVFGVFFVFIVFSTLGLGPAGAVLYRMAEFASRQWSYRGGASDTPVNDRLRMLSQRLFSLIDHVPARMTAFGFAVVGNFEEAVHAWRRDAELWLHPNEGIILAAAAGAVGVQLGGGVAPGGSPDQVKTFEDGIDGEASASRARTPGETPQVRHLQSVVGLVWRSVALWLLLLALLSLANLIG